MGWVAWFSAARPLEPIAYVPQAEFEAQYHRSLTAATEPVLNELRFRSSRGGSAFCVTLTVTDEPRRTH
jgi:hypothetical protein